MFRLCRVLGRQLTSHSLVWTSPATARRMLRFGVARHMFGGHRVVPLSAITGRESDDDSDSELDAKDFVSANDILREKKDQTLAFVPCSYTILQAMDTMRRRNVSSVLVEHSQEDELLGHCAGIFTEKDYLRCVHLAESAADSCGVSVLEACTPVEDIIFAFQFDKLRHLMELLHANHIRHLPVLSNNPGDVHDKFLQHIHEDEPYRIVGIITVNDLVSHDYEHLVNRTDGFLDAYYFGIDYGGQ